jgi:LysR family transcriptional activator of mexEF-oprN operon
VVEDQLRRQRRIRCSVSTFAHLGGLLDGSALLATVPETVARQLRQMRPHLQIRALPFALRGGPSELLWPAAADDGAPYAFARDQIRAIARRVVPRRDRRPRRAAEVPRRAPRTR